MYTYPATFVSTIDERTIIVRLDFKPLGVFLHTPLRLSGYQAPQSVGPTRDQGFLAQGELRKLMQGKELLVDISPGAPGRFLHDATVTVCPDDADPFEVAERLIWNGWAVEAGAPEPDWGARYPLRDPEPELDPVSMLPGAGPAGGGG